MVASVALLPTTSRAMMWVRHGGCNVTMHVQRWTALTIHIDFINPSWGTVKPTRLRSDNHVTGNAMHSAGYYSWWLNCNSLSPRRSRGYFKNAVFNVILLTSTFRSSNDNAFGLTPRGLTNNMSALVKVMAWCRQATSHYLNHWWPRSMLPYGIIICHNKITAVDLKFRNPQIPSTGYPIFK